jgi:hypothetical protein
LGRKGEMKWQGKRKKRTAVKKDKIVSRQDQLSVKSCRKIMLLAPSRQKEGVC